MEKYKLTIHPSSIVSKNASLGKDVCVGPYSIIYDNVIIGDNTRIDGFCEIGVSSHLSGSNPLTIGANSHIRSHSIIYGDSTFGDGLVTGHRCTVREKTSAGKNLQIGTLSDLQGHLEIGDYVRLHSNVHIGQKSKIGNFIWIFPYVVITNDPHPPSNYLLGATIEDFAIIATMSVVLPGTVISEGCLVAAHACIGDKTQKDCIYAGNPARLVGPTTKIKLKSTRQPAYPWRKHFHRGYPSDIVQNWIKEFQDTADAS